MASQKRHESGRHQYDGGHGHGPEHDWDDDGDDFDLDFDFDLPEVFKIDFDNLNLKKLGKITDYDISHKELSVTFGNSWTFSVEGSDLDFELKGKSKLPDVTGGTIDSFSIDGPGKADFSISSLDMSAEAFYDALVSFNAVKLLNLVLGGNETISGSGFGDFIYGGDGDDTILGNKGADHLAGGGGNDLIDGGAGNDYLLGNGGADIFTFAPNSGMDLIADFDVTSDVLDLTAYGFGGCVGNFLEEHVVSGEDGGRCDDDWDEDVIIDLGGGNAVKLEGVSRWELTADNVLL